MTQPIQFYSNIFNLHNFEEQICICNKNVHVQNFCQVHVDILYYWLNLLISIIIVLIPTNQLENINTTPKEKFKHSHHITIFKHDMELFDLKNNSWFHFFEFFIIKEPLVFGWKEIYNQRTIGFS
jgi:hypothetical protein